MKEKVAIQVENIGKSFGGVQALDNVSLSIYKGEVHAIIGENGAGKSTLMGILAGELQPDSGKLYLNGELQSIANPIAARELRIGLVHQNPALCPNLNVTQNVFLGKEAYSKLKTLNWRMMHDETEKLIGEVGLELDPRTQVVQLSIAQQQMVGIAKVLNEQAEIVLMDEPNSALSPDETENLFKIVRGLRSRKITVVYVSHRLEEVFSIANRVSVLRDGKYVGTLSIEEATIEQIIKMMVGRVVTYRGVGQETAHKADKVDRESLAPLLEVQNLTTKGKLDDISFKLYPGEILGLAGLQGAGRTELAHCLFGLDKVDKGKIIVNGREIKLTDPGVAIKEGIALITEDRLETGLFGPMDIKDNISMVKVRDLDFAGFIQRKEVVRTASRFAKLLDIRMKSLFQNIFKLSGGNQQKVIVARWLACGPKILIADEPTRGIDVGAKEEIYGVIQRLKAEDMGILLISSELPELIRETDRVLVMSRGRFTGELIGQGITQENIMKCAVI